MLSTSPISIEIRRRLFLRSPSFCSGRDTIDYSKFPPEIAEKEIECSFVKGWGPGGQSVNTSSNAVQLRHIPTGILVKVHDTRSRQSNYKIALQRLRQSLDHHLNAENSVENQKKRIEAANHQKQKLASQRKRDFKNSLKEQLLNQNPEFSSSGKGKRAFKEALKAELERVSKLSPSEKAKLFVSKEEETSNKKTINNNNKNNDGIDENNVK